MPVRRVKSAASSRAARTRSGWFSWIQTVSDSAVSPPSLVAPAAPATRERRQEHERERDEPPHRIPSRLSRSTCSASAAVMKLGPVGTTSPCAGNRP